MPSTDAFEMREDSFIIRNSPSEKSENENSSRLEGFGGGTLLGS